MQQSGQLKPTQSVEADATIALRIAKQGPTFEDVQLLAGSKKFSAALASCDELLRGAGEKAAQSRRLAAQGKKKGKGQLLAMAAAGFADKGKQRVELPSFVRNGPAIGYNKPSAGFAPVSEQRARADCRHRVAAVCLGSASCCGVVGSNPFKWRLSPMLPHARSAHCVYTLCTCTHPWFVRRPGNYTMVTDLRQEGGRGRLSLGSSSPALA